MSYRVYLGEDVTNHVNIRHGRPELETGETTDVLRFVDDNGVVAEFINPYGWVAMDDEDDGQGTGYGGDCAGCSTTRH